MLLLQYHLLIYIFLLTRVGNGLGSYIVEVTVHSYQNPTGRCVRCQSGLEAGCCDEDFIRPANEMCPTAPPNVCDPGVSYCDRAIGVGECEEIQPPTSTQFMFNTNSIDFDSPGSPLGLDNPVVVEREEPWNGIEFVLVPWDLFCTSSGCFGNRIDVVIVTIDVPVGTKSSEQTYSGVADIAEFVVSFDVRCADDHYGGDCTTNCSDFVSCEGCGLPGYTGEFCQFPTENCSEVYCNGNGECGIDRPVCNCEPGFTGERCEDNIDECEGEECSGNGRCEDRVNGFMCLCDPGYTGERCEDDIDECEGIDCSGNGRCEDRVNGFVCACEPGYTGERCDIDQCQGVECSNNGRCEEGICICDPGSTGDSCEERIQSEGAAAGAIAGGVVGAVLGIMIAIAIIVVIVVMVLWRGGHTCAAAVTRQDDVINNLGDNPTYGMGNTQGSHPIPTTQSQGNDNTAAAASNDFSTSAQKREFDNPIYSSDPLEEVDADEDPYTVPDSPPSNVYDRVADDNPVQLGVAIPPRVGTSTDSGHSNYYSTINM